jgi:hypothetical protein
LLNWETPTLGGFLTMALGWHWFKLMGLIILPLSTIVWWKRCDQITQPALIAVSLLFSVVTAPFGWNYDVVVLLLPLLQVALWVCEEEYGRFYTILFPTLFLLANWLAIRQRIQSISEVYLFWFPLFIALLYLWARTRHKQMQQYLAAESKRNTPSNRHQYR